LVSWAVVGFGNFDDVELQKVNLIKITITLEVVGVMLAKENKMDGPDAPSGVNSAKAAACPSIA
jgi:hypothetical protein